MTTMLLLTTAFSTTLGLHVLALYWFGPRPTPRRRALPSVRRLAAM